MSLLCGRKEYRKEDGYEQSFIYHGYRDGYRKTYVTGLIVKKLAEEGKSAAYYKAAMSGNDRRADGSLIPGDALFVQKYRGLHSRLRKCVLMYMNMHIHRILLHGSRDIRWRWLWSEMATGQYVINMIM